LESKVSSHRVAEWAITLQSLNVNYQVLGCIYSAVRAL